MSTDPLRDYVGHDILEAEGSSCQYKGTTKSRVLPILNFTHQTTLLLLLCRKSAAVMWPTGASSHLLMGCFQFAIVITTVSSLAFVIWRRINRDAGQIPLPPGPPGWPVIGNAPTIITESIKGLQHLLMLKWAREYGEIFGVRIGPFQEYFINTDAAVKVWPPCHWIERHLSFAGALRPLVLQHFRATPMDRQQ